MPHWRQRQVAPAPLEGGKTRILRERGDSNFDSFILKMNHQGGTGQMLSNQKLFCEDWRMEVVWMMQESVVEYVWLAQYHRSEKSRFKNLAKFFIFWEARVELLLPHQPLNAVNTIEWIVFQVLTVFHRQLAQQYRLNKSKGRESTVFFLSFFLEGTDC